jgi:hypothetical protein
VRGAPPTIAVRDNLAYSDLKRSFADLDPPDQSEQLVISRSEFLSRPLPEPAIAELVDELGSGLRPGEHRELNFTALGGAYDDVPPDATAFVHRGERFLLEHVAVGADNGWVHRSRAIAHPHASGGVYPNFPDPDLTDWAQAYHGANHTRLTAVKRHYDPDRVFHFPQSL